MAPAVHVRAVGAEGTSSKVAEESDQNIFNVGTSFVQLETKLHNLINY